MVVISDTRSLGLRRVRIGRVLSLPLAVIAAVLCWQHCGRLSAQETSPAKTTPAQETPATDKPQSPASDDAADRELQQLDQLLSRPAVQAPALQQEVSTVSRQTSTVGKSPAAVFVITNEMITRSGATTVAEALRMAPGLDVAKIDSGNWAVSSRGFNDRFANKMLVQVDGRTVYNPIFSGVYWQTVDLLLQDVERIEVIRGPGATVWGSNAVNGIINVITKTSKETQGGLLFSGGGNQERGLGGFRYGGQTEDDVTYRVWGKWREVDHGFNPDGEARQDWRSGHGGFRLDWAASESDTLTFQGELFGNKEGVLERHPLPTVAPPSLFTGVEDRQLTGANLLGRFTHQIDEDSDWRLQAYYDNFGLTSSIASFDINTFDVDFQHRFKLSPNQRFIYGFAYRFQDIIFRPSNYAQFGLPPNEGFQLQTFPAGRDLSLPSAFLQDEIILLDDRLTFTAGCKFEDNPFVDFVYQPSARLLWTPTERQAAWAAASRGVRTPNFQEHNIRITQLPVGLNTFPRVFPSPNFQSENVMSYELGYRAQPVDDFSWDVATFYSVYDSLRTAAVTGAPIADPPSTFIPLNFQNRMDGESYGVELTGNLKLTDWWRLYGQYSFLRMQLHAPSVRSAEAAERQSPRNQVYLWSSWDLSEQWQFDVMGRYVDHLSGFGAGAADTPVPSYIEMDVRLGWMPNKNLTLAVVGQNLLDGKHLEFGTNPLVGRPLVEAERGVYGTVALQW